MSWWYFSKGWSGKRNPLNGMTVDRVTAGVWLDLDLVDDLILKAAKNKGRKAHDGAVFVEIHMIEPVT